MVALLLVFSFAMQKVSDMKTGKLIWSAVGVVPLIAVLMFAFLDLGKAESMAGFFLMLFVPPAIAWALIAFVAFRHWKNKVTEGL